MSEFERAKPSPVISTHSSPEDAEENVLVSEKEGTRADVVAMARMGKKQETRRNFQAITIFGFTMVQLATWEAVLSVAILALMNGGTGGLIWGYLAVMLAFGFIIASMAEMASMAPTSGGQYHWVSEFAPRSCQRFLSFLTGWLAVLGWQTAAATVAFLSGTQIQGLITLNNFPTYMPERWQGTLLVWVIALIATAFNTFFSRRLPLVEGVVVILHLIGFFAILIPLWVMADRADAHTVFTSFEDNGGWGSVGLSTCVGLLGAAGSFVGVDSGAHMSEEVRDSAKVVPRTMMWTWFGNGLLGWIMAITFCFCVGNVEDVLISPTGYPFMAIFYNATGSKAGATVMACILLVVSIFGCVAVIATNSRQMFAFARDNGVPFSRIFATVSPTYEIPLNAVYFSVTVVILLSLINIGSTVAFNSILALGTGAMLSTYMISIGCITLKRLRGEPLLPSKFDLGKAGLPINIISLLSLAFFFVFSFFPPSPNPTPATMNWGILGWGAVVVFATVYYFIWARRTYIAPVDKVKMEY